MLQKTAIFEYVYVQQTHVNKGYMHRDMTKVNRHLKFIHFICIKQVLLRDLYEDSTIYLHKRVPGSCMTINSASNPESTRPLRFSKWTNCWPIRRLSQLASDFSEPWHSAFYGQSGDCAIYQRRQGIHSFPFWSIWALRKVSLSCQAVH